uniref:BESS domain-containing protein n=1 Tax=Oryzias latipes TaxID=8090 RepID=A0A3P9IDA6_ORYLA
IYTAAKKTKKMQGKMNLELLVSLVSEHKELYDKRDSDYRNLYKRELLWSGIAQQMGLDGDLRDTYTHKKREEDCRSGQAAKHKKPWKFMKVMEFLATSTEFRSCVSSQVVVQKDVSHREEGSASPSSGSTFSGPTVTRSTLNKRKRPETPDLLDRYLLSKEARESEKEKRGREKEERREQQNDENYLFALGLIPALKRLSPALQSSVKLKIHQLLDDAEFGQASSAVFTQQSPVSYHQVLLQTPPNYGCSTSWLP